MAAGPAIEMWSRQSGTRESPDGRRRMVTLERAYTVTLAATDDLDDATRAEGLPLVNDSHPRARLVIVRKLSLKRLSPILALVTAHYSGEVSPDDINGTPVDTKVRVTGVWNITEEPIDEDINGVAIVNANDEPVDGLTERVADDVITIERNFLTFNRFAFRAYKWATNSDTFYGWPPGTARIMQLRDQAEYVNGIAEYYRVTAEVHFREPLQSEPDRAWWKRVRHEGMLVRPQPFAKPLPAWDEASKSPARRPVLLKEDGTRETNPENAFFREYQTLNYLPFAAIGLLS